MTRQLGWLVFYRGKWHLITGKPPDHIRQWIDEEAALSDLADEGWDISGSYPKRLLARKHLREMFYGYGLRRTIH